MTTHAAVLALAERVFDDVRSTLAAGQAEYAHDPENAFRNFESIAERSGLTREQVLLIYKLKHVDGITAWVNGHRSQRESVTGRLKDDIVYDILLWAMTEEERLELDGELSGLGHNEIRARAEAADVYSQGRLAEARAIVYGGGEATVGVVSAPLNCEFCKAKVYVTKSGDAGEETRVVCSNYECDHAGPLRKDAFSAVDAWNRIQSGLMMPLARAFSSCPACGYPDTFDGEHYKGVYDPKLTCDHCGYGP